jgi:hypothetical protein
MARLGEEAIYPASPAPPRLTDSLYISYAAIPSPTSLSLKAPSSSPSSRTRSTARRAVEFRNGSRSARLRTVEGLAAFRTSITPSISSSPSRRQPQHSAATLRSHGGRRRQILLASPVRLFLLTEEPCVLNWSLHSLLSGLIPGGESFNVPITDLANRQAQWTMRVPAGTGTSCCCI